STSFTTSLLSQAAGYVVSWQSFSHATAMAGDAGSFALGGAEAYLSYELLGGGGRITGGTFSRRKWRELKDAIRAERDAEERARARVKARERAAARAAPAAAKAALEAARRVEDEALAEQSNIRLIAGARDALSGAQGLGAALRDAAARAA